MSEKDFLTGFFSKETIDSVIDKIKAECDVDRKPFSLLILDLDHFKTYNDKYGHLDGDEILRYFASTLRISLEHVGTDIFRFGGDEFIIVFPGKVAKEALSIAHDLMKILKKRPFLSRGRTYKLTFSGGITSYPADGREIKTLIQLADKAMQYSKTHGRGRTTLYKHILPKIIKKLSVIFAFILLALGILLFLQQSSYKDYILDWLKEQTRKVSATIMSSSAKIYTEDLDLVYLKSGRILRGIIVRDDKDEIELNLNLETGAGTITVKRSEIESIKKRSEKDSPAVD